MNELDKIKSIAKSAYRTSIVNNYEEIEDDLWEIILFLDKLETSITKPTTTRVNIDDNKYRDIAYIAYVLSECGHKVFDKQKTQLEVIENLANILGTKPLTLRNIRDSLDTYTNSTREGWKKPLIDRLQFVFDECKILSCEEVTNNAKNILLKYQ